MRLEFEGWISSIRGSSDTYIPLFKCDRTEPMERASGGRWHGLKTQHPKTKNWIFWWNWNTRMKRVTEKVTKSITWEFGSMMGESSNAVGLMPGGIVRQGDWPAAEEGEGEGKGLVVVLVRNLAVLILAALELKPLLSAMLLFAGNPGKPPPFESEPMISSLPLLLLTLLLLLLLSCSMFLCLFTTRLSHMCGYRIELVSVRPNWENNKKENESELELENGRCWCYCCNLNCEQVVVVVVVGFGSAPEEWSWNQWKWGFEACSAMQSLFSLTQSHSIMWKMGPQPMPLTYLYIHIGTCACIKENQIKQ